MELHERLTTARSAPTPGRDDPFAEIKNRVHMAVIGDLGPQLFNVSMDPIALRERVLADIRDQQEPGKPRVRVVRMNFLDILANSAELGVLVKR